MPHFMFCDFLSLAHSFTHSLFIHSNTQHTSLSSLAIQSAMAPSMRILASTATATATATRSLVFRVNVDSPPPSLHSLSIRDLQNPTHTQQVTLGVIAAYVVVIAILWNVPYLRMILWPFKVCMFFFCFKSQGFPLFFF